jgi:mRNA-degrading endonuclease RelE of RelBE toxin-antitoxin system
MITPLCSAHWATCGRGKRGGVRIIYYGKIREGVIWMLTIYGKNVAENIPAHIGGN